MMMSQVLGCITEFKCPKCGVRVIIEEHIWHDRIGQDNPIFCPNGHKTQPTGALTGKGEGKKGHCHSTSCINDGQRCACDCEPCREICLHAARSKP